MYALVDCNNFFASCERVFRPDLIGKPIVVLSNNDGCVISRSNEAKELGVPMGALAFQYESFFRQYNVSVFSGNYVLYGDMSNRVMDLLREFTPKCDVYSIDETFMELTGFDYYNLVNYGAEIQKKVKQCTGIPISVGIAPTYSLAKVANHISKKYPDKTQNSYVIDTEEKRVKALKWLPVKDVWGIGRRHAARLLKHGILTAYDFTQLSDDWVKRNMSVIELRLKKDLSGIPSIQLDEIKPRKSISVSRSFERNITEFNYLKERIASFSVICAERLRKQNSCCNSLMVYIQTNRQRKELSQYGKSFLMQLPFPTNSSIELAQFAQQALQLIFKEGYSYKRMGVIMMDFSPVDQLQLSIFENSNPKHVQLMNVMDRLNNSFGERKIKLASQDQKRVWKTKQEKLSPCYTTKLSDIIIVKA